MKTLDDVCRQIDSDLKQLATEIVALEADMASFEEHAARYPVEQVGLRLQRVRLRIYVEVLERYEKHGNQGSICIMTAHNGVIGVAWHTEEPILTDADKSWTAPVTTLPAEQFSAFTKQLLQQLSDGDWEPAVSWLNANAIWLTTGERL